MKILGIGNAIVDVLCKVSDEFLTQHSLTKSTMKLIDEIENGGWRMFQSWRMVRLATVNLN